MNKKIYIVQRRLTHYRVPFFNALRDELSSCDIKLALLYGNGTDAEEAKQDAGELAWATCIPTRYFLDGKLCWQPIRPYINDADLVIVTQENKLLQNHLLMLLPRSFKLAFWGHGANLQSDNPHGIKECFKRWTTNQVDWWFAYTQMSADLVQNAGFPLARVTVLNNAVDTSALQQQWQSITLKETRALRQALGFHAGPVAVFVGSLYSDKRLDFLMAAAERIQRQIPEFQLLIIGEGPERAKVQTWCESHQWTRWAGARFGRDKAHYLSLTEIMLNPGLVGLGILDSFVCGIPIVTTDCGIHSPEIAYLENGVNGIMTANDLNAYVNACVKLIQDEAWLDQLRKGCASSAEEYTVENMARHFADGIVDALQCDSL